MNATDAQKQVRDALNEHHKEVFATKDKTKQLLLYVGRQNMKDEARKELRSRGLKAMIRLWRWRTPTGRSIPRRRRLIILIPVSLVGKMSNAFKHNPFDRMCVYTGIYTLPLSRICLYACLVSVFDVLYLHILRKTGWKNQRTSPQTAARRRRRGETWLFMILWTIGHQDLACQIVRKHTRARLFSLQNHSNTSHASQIY